MYDIFIKLIRRYGCGLFFFFLHSPTFCLGIKNDCGDFYAKRQKHFLRKREKGQVKRNEKDSLNVMIKHHLGSLSSIVSTE